MPSRIMIGQLPLIIEEDENVGEFASPSRLSIGQGSLKDGGVAPADVITNASNNEIPKGELEPKLVDENQDNNPACGTNDNGRKRKRYHRHTQHQIQELEAFFKMCPHPDDNQRKQLSRDLGLEPLQVKFWFQNKRTQMKAYHERAENERLKAENEKLRAENIKYREALTKASCFTCGGAHAFENISTDEHQLRVENIRLRKEVENITSLAAKFDVKTYANFTLESPSVVLNPLEFERGGAFGGQPNNVGKILGEDDLRRSLTGATDFYNITAIEIAVSAMEEFIRMSKMELPLWIQTMDHIKYVFNEDAYYSMFPATIWLKSAGFKTEASRDTNIVMMNHTNLIEVFMDVDKWLAMFASMVSRALVLEVISVGVEPGNYNGALQVMSAEFQVLTPCVPTRECIFIRYCKQLAEDTWAVVDVSCDNLFSSIPPAKCQRKPSGCIIQEMPNGFSKVTWIEHVEVDDQGTHYLGKSFVESGLAFGAQRWVAILSRQCERLRSTMVTNFSLDDINDTVLTNPETRKNILKLSERMVLNFCGGVTSSTAYSWMNLHGSGNEETRIMTKKHENDPDNSSGTMLNATTWFWIPVPQKIVFEFLRDESSRSEWDVLFNGGGIQELVHITNGQETGNCVSLIRGSNLSQSDVLILQECSFDPTSSSVIYAPVDNVSIKQLLDGGNPDDIAILPSGFTIFPCNAPATIQDRAIGGAEVVGSLVTVAFQILIDSVPAAKLPSTSVSVINGLVEATKQKIKAILAPNHD